MKKVFFFVIFSIIVVGVVFFYLFVIKKDLPTSTNSLPTSTPAKVTKSVGLNTYANEKWGYSFNYPSDFKTNDSLSQPSLDGVVFYGSGQSASLSVLAVAGDNTVNVDNFIKTEALYEDKSILPSTSTFPQGTTVRVLTRNGSSNPGTAFFYKVFLGKVLSGGTGSLEFTCESKDASCATLLVHIIPTFKFTK